MHVSNTENPLGKHFLSFQPRLAFASLQSWNKGWPEQWIETLNRPVTFRVTPLSYNISFAKCIIECQKRFLFSNPRFRFTAHKTKVLRYIAASWKLVERRQSNSKDVVLRYQDRSEISYSCTVKMPGDVSIGRDKVNKWHGRKFSVRKYVRAKCLVAIYLYTRYGKIRFTY